MPQIRVLHVVGARPNFMKAAPLVRELAGQPDIFAQILVHTGQHYDATMSGVFFRELGLPEPDVNLEAGSGTHAAQTAQVMLRFEPVITNFRPDWVVVPGDVNSTLACALVAAKLGIKVAHVEAGLRSFDRTMPEEINRVLTDQISDLLLTPSADANENLAREGVQASRIHLVGNIMIDTLARLLPCGEARWANLAEKHGLTSGRFVLATLHRPSNVDETEPLTELLGALKELAGDTRVVFPVHPRTLLRICALGLDVSHENLLLLPPLGYLDFLALQMHAGLVITDSGGVQEETTWLGVPCLTARANTERPVTITHGTNTLVASRQAAIVGAAHKKLSAREARCAPPLWDGATAGRIARVLADYSPASDHGAR